MITTAFAHGIERVSVTRAHNHLEIELYGPERTIRSASVTVFGDALIRTRPALTLDGVDPIASIDAARHALALLDEALEGLPTSIPQAVFDARDALARGLTVPTANTFEGV